MAIDNGPGALAGATGAGGDQVGGEQLPDTTNDHTGPTVPEALAVLGAYELLEWVPCEWASGRVGIAMLRLPSGKIGSFAIYNLSQQFAEWWPTSRIRRLTRRDWQELNTALPVAVELIRKYDPKVLAPFHGLLRRSPPVDGIE